MGASAAAGGASGGAAAALASVASICDLFFALFDLGLQQCVPRGFLTEVEVQGDYARQGDNTRTAASLSLGIIAQAWRASVLHAAS